MFTADSSTAGYRRGEGRELRVERSSATSGHRRKWVILSGSYPGIRCGVSPYVKRVAELLAGRRGKRRPQQHGFLAFRIDEHQGRLGVERHGVGVPESEQREHRATVGHRRNACSREVGCDWNGG